MFGARDTTTLNEIYALSDFTVRSTHEECSDKYANLLQLIKNILLKNSEIVVGIVGRTSGPNFAA